MLLENEILSLREDTTYKSFNGFTYNFKYVKDICRHKSGSVSISAAINTAGVLSFSLSLVNLLWFVLKFYYIKKELVLCRSDIIEVFLNKEYIKQRNAKIIEDSIEKTGYYWIEYEYEKVKKMQAICRFYLEDIKVRKVILEYSTENEADKRKKLQVILDEIEMIFAQALEYLNNKTYHSRLKKNPEMFVSAIQNSFSNGVLTLTDKEDK